MKKDNFGRQFKGGYYPQEPISPGGPILREASPPSMRARKGVTLGSETEAYPGMVGKNDFKRTKKKRKR